MTSLMLAEQHLGNYELWCEIRDHFEIELVSIERSLRNDADQIGTSAEAIYASAERLKELVPELKAIARALEDEEWRELERRKSVR